MSVPHENTGGSCILLLYYSSHNVSGGTDQRDSNTSSQSVIKYVPGGVSCCLSVNKREK